MRKLAILFLLAVMALPAWAQEMDENDIALDIQSAVQSKEVVENSSKAEEYGEIPQSFLINRIKTNFGFEKNKDRYLKFRGTNVLLNNAIYSLSLGEQGSYNLTVDYQKIPHLFSISGTTIWTEVEPGVWRIPDDIQSTIQGLNPTTPTNDRNNPDYATYQANLVAQKDYVSNMVGNAHETPLGLTRHRGRVAFDKNQGTAWKYKLEYFQENRDGTRPFGTSLGFSWVNELPETIDYKTRRIRAGTEYARNGKSFAAGYELSLFKNEHEVLTWDNPLRIDDRTWGSAYSAGDGTSQGRVQLPGDNMANTVDMAAAVNFGKSRVTGSFAYGVWSNSQDLLPFTINSAIEEIPLPANTFNGKINNMNANVGFNTRFASKGSFSARYRLQDQTNKSDQLLFTEYVRFDQVLEEFEEEGGEYNHNIDFSSNSIDLDAGWALTSRINVGGGFGFNRFDRERSDVNSTDTKTYRAKVDARASDWATFRVSYQMSQRRFDTYHLEGTYEVVPLYRFYEADVDRNRVLMISNISLGDRSNLGFTAGYNKDDYIDTEFGVQEVKGYSAGVDYSYSMSDRSDLNFWYERDQRQSFQQGRQSGSSPSEDPLADWTADITDVYNTFGAGLTQGFKTDWTWAISGSYAQADGKADLYSPPGGTPDVAVGFTNSDDTDLFSASTSLSYRITSRMRIGGYYGFQRYMIDDYGEDTTIADMTSVGAVTLGAIQPDYIYHVGWIGISSMF